MKFAIGVSIMALFISMLSAAEDDPLTDEELIHSCLRTAAKHISSELADSGFTEICILERIPRAGDENDAILIEALSREMIEIDARIFFKNEDDEIESPTFFYRIVSQGVLMEEKEQLLSEPLYIREAKAVVSYRLLEPLSGEILFSSEVEKTLTNEIKKSEYLSLKKGMKQTGASLIRFLEPAIVIAIVAGLMYLFYSQKSSQ